MINGTRAMGARATQLDRAMMDADVVLSKIHFEILRSDIYDEAGD